MNKKIRAIGAALLVGIWVVLTGFAWFAPAKESSDAERRPLEQMPDITLETLLNGKFMTKFEDYTLDQFPLRDKWINLKAWGERILGKQENNKVYFGTDGDTLFAQFNPPADLDKRIEYINKFAEKAGVPVYFGLIPDKSFVWADRLPANAPTWMTAP